jgi:hypothetical protein
MALGELLEIQQLPSSHHQVADGQCEGSPPGFFTSQNSTR